MKILHISDLHFGHHHPHVATYFLNELEGLKPDLILISGDLTQRAKKEQYQEAAQFFNKMPGKKLIVPGNHDVPLYDIFSRLMNPFERYRRYVSADLEAAYQDTEVRILGVNSTNPYRIKDGTLSAATLKKIETHFRSDYNGVNILFFHHYLDHRYATHNPLENHDLFLDYLRDSPIHLVCTGHSHYANLSKLEKRNQQDCLLLHAGSLMCMRTQDHLNSFYSIEVEEGKIKITWQVVRGARFVGEQIYPPNM